MELALTPELQQFVDDHVASGRFADANELVLTAIALLQLQEQQDCEDIGEASLDELKAALAEGRADVARGRVLSRDEVHELVAKLKAQHRSL